MLVFGVGKYAYSLSGGEFEEKEGGAGGWLWQKVRKPAYQHL